MRRLLFTPDGLPSKLFERTAVSVVLIWIISAVIVPVFMHIPNWESLQIIWDRWQTLNTGMLAFLASFMALSATRFAEKMNARRELRAALPSLAHALSSLSRFLRSASNELLQRLNIQFADVARPPEGDRRTIERESLQALRDIVKFGAPPVADFASRLIIELQVFDARMREVFALEGDQIISELSRLNYLYYTLSLVVIRARVNYLFSFARGELEYFESKLSREQILDAFPMFFRRPEYISEEQWRDMIDGTIRRANQPLSYATD